MAPASRPQGFSTSSREGPPALRPLLCSLSLLSKSAKLELSSFIYDASLYIYDDDHDVFVEINCADEALLAKAVATFNAITPLTRHDVVDGSVLYTPVENPSAELLLEAGEAVAALFERSGYKKMALERSQW